MKQVLSTMRFPVLLAILMLFLVVPAAAATGSGTGAPAQPASGMIFVKDFALDAGDATQQRGILPRRQGGILGNHGPNPEEMVETLSISLVKELQSKSIPARRLYPGQPGPMSGWVVSGEFLEVGEGNRLRRAAIGFGAGSTEMQVEVSVYDLSSGSGEPFLVFGSESKSGRGPGAVVTMNPYVMAAKFVLSKKATAKDIHKTARDIAAVLVKYMQDSGKRPQ